MNRGMIGAVWLDEPGNFALSSPSGDVVLFERQPSRGIYEFHWLHKVSPLRSLVAFTLEAMAEMFRATDCRIIVGYVAKARKDSALAARMIGAKFLGEVPSEHGTLQMFIKTKGN